jgi:multimeric flavodoxin WrbA
MKILAINGSPRKGWNTAILLKKTLEGAASQGADTELIHLYDLNFKGCVSCFACKTIGGKSYGKCVLKDELTPVLKEIEEAHAIIIGSPVYFGSHTGEVRAFMERLLFPYVTYTDPPQSLFPKKINTGFIYTMNVTEEQFKEYHFQDITTFVMTLAFGATESLCSFDTYQFDDYSKILSTRFDPEKKAKRREEIFPEDCKKAFEMGARFAKS